MYEGNLYTPGAPEIPSRCEVSQLLADENRVAQSLHYYITVRANGSFLAFLNVSTVEINATLRE